MMELQNEATNYDAVWPASGIWITLGDRQKKVKYQQSIMTSPVVFGIKKSLAQKLGFIGSPVKVTDLLKAINEKKLRFIMTSASQSNSGASAYFGFLYALLGNPEYITIEDLHKPELKAQIRSLLSGINRSSGSSGWLKDLFLKGDYDAMVNYESVLIETNQELIRQGREPLYLVYAVDGLVLADSQFGYVNNGDDKKESFFKELQEYLLSPDVQNKLLQLGRRTGFAGEIENAPKDVFNPDWGINTKQILSPIKLPASDVILEALNLYQTDFRKPSYTVFCLDYSGSMQGERNKQVIDAMEILLNQENARKYLLQFSSEDIIDVIPFSDITTFWEAAGSDKTQLDSLMQLIKTYEVGGQTDIYTPVIMGLNKISGIDLNKYIPAIILMTDGESNCGQTLADLNSCWDSLKIDVPVFAIKFGDASDQQLKDITELTRSTIFDGTKDLVTAFRKAKGYN
jgi:Ca-activated chloride channel family protein